MGERAGGEVQPGYVGGRVVNVSKWLEGFDHPVLLIRESIKGVIVVVDLPVKFGDPIGIAKGRAETARQAGEWISGGHLVEKVLLDALRIHKEEQLVLQDGAAQPAAKLI